LQPELLLEASEALTKILGGRADDDDTASKIIDEDVKNFEKSFQAIVDALPDLIKLPTKAGGREKQEEITPYNEEKLHANEDLFHSLLNYIALQVCEKYIFATEVFFKATRADLVLFGKGGRGVILEVKYNYSA